MDRSIARPSKLTGSILAVSADIVIRRWAPGQSDEWLLVEVKGGAKDVDRYARAAAYDLLAYRTAFDKVLTDNRKAYGLGIGWGAGLEPAPDKPIMLCTPDTLPDALAGLFAAEGRR